MWYYQIVSKYGDCLEGGTFRDKEEMCRYCERRMKQLNAYTWSAEYSEEAEDELSSKEMILGAV